MNQQQVNQPEEMTAEQYKFRVMQQRFAERVTEYEDIIATLLTQKAQLEQELEQYTGGFDEESVSTQ